MKSTILFVLLFTIAISAEQDEDNSESKILVNPNDNSLLNPKPPRNPPTTEQVEFEAGIPPGYTKPHYTTKSTKRPRRTQKTTAFPAGPSKLPIYSEGLQQEEEINSSGNVVEIKPTLTTSTYPPGVSPPEPIIIDPDRGNAVVDWLLQAVGLKPTEKPVQAVNVGPSNFLENASSKGCRRCTCGITYQHNRIVGGVETQVNEYPWMVVLMNNNRFYCGASVINTKYLLSAGHCVNGVTKEKLLAVFLDHDRSTTTDTQTFFRRIIRIIKHGAYGIGASYNNDIALLQVEYPLSFDGILKPVCLPAIGKSYSGQIGIVTGWGAISSGGSVSNKLREVRVPILSHEDCRRTGYGDRVTDKMLCAGFPQGTKDSCQGDSGGPLHVLNGSHHVIVGVVSWGEGCAKPNFPGVYTRVNRFISWILGNTEDGCYC